MELISLHPKSKRQKKISRIHISFAFLSYFSSKEMPSYFPPLKIESEALTGRSHRASIGLNYFPRSSSKYVTRNLADSTWPSCGTIYVAHNSESNGLILHAGGRKEETRAMLMQSGRPDTCGVYTVYHCANTQLHARIDACRSGTRSSPLATGR